MNLFSHFNSKYINYFTHILKIINKFCNIKCFCSLKLILNQKKSYIKYIIYEKLKIK